MKTMIWFFVCVMVIVVAALLSEVQPKPKKFELSSGRVVLCRGYDTEYCGVRLTDCDDEQSYICQTNVRQVK